MPITPEALQTWLAAVEEGYAAPLAWRPWAERALQAASDARPWLVEMIEAETEEAATRAIHRGLAEVTSGRWPLDHGSLRLGFLWLCHEREDLDATDLLDRAGVIADRSGGAGVPDGSAFHGLLDEVSGDGPALPSALSLNRRIAALFAPHAALARACLPHLAR
ncbi:MAG: hypothetical protein QM820_38575 [Minicystis sp.]